MLLLASRKRIPLATCGGFPVCERGGLGLGDYNSALLQMSSVKSMTGDACQFSSKSLGTASHLIDQPLNGNSSGLTGGVRVEVCPIATASFETGNVVDVFDSDPSSFEGAGIGQVEGVQARRNGDGERVHSWRSGRKIGERAINLLDHRRRHGLVLVPVDAVQLCESNVSVDASEIRSGRNLFIIFSSAPWAER